MSSSSASDKKPPGGGDGGGGGHVAQGDQSKSHHSPVASVTTTTTATTTTAATTTSTTTGAMAMLDTSSTRPTPPEAKRQRTAAAPPPTTTNKSSSLIVEPPAATTTRRAAAAAAAAATAAAGARSKTTTTTTTTTTVVDGGSNNNGSSSNSNSPMLLPDAAAWDATASATNLSLLHQVTHLSWVFSRNNNNNDYCGQWHAQGTTSLYVVDNSAATAAAAAKVAALAAAAAATDKSSSSSSSTSPPQQQSAAAAARAAATAATAAAANRMTTLALHLKGSCHVLQVQVEALNKRAILTPLSNTTFLHADPLQHVLVKSPSSYCIQDFIMLEDADDNSNNNNNNSSSKGNNDQDDDARNINSSSSSSSSSRNRLRRRPYRFDADAQSSRGAMGMTKGLRAASIASNKGELFICCPRAEILVGANAIATITTVVSNTKTTTANTPSTSGGGGGGGVDNSSTTSTTTPAVTATTSPAQEAAMKAWQRALTASSSSSSSSSSASTANINNNNNSSTSPRKPSLNNVTATTPATSPTSSAAATATAAAATTRQDHDSALLFGTGMLDLQSRLYHRSQTRRPKRIQLISRRLAAASASPIRNTAFRVTIHWRIPLSSSDSSTISRYHLGGLHVLTGSDDDLPAVVAAAAALGGGGDSTVASKSSAATTTATTTPHVYTTAGVLGDHQGPRSWLPCLDAGSSSFRASHELYVKLTAPVREGLSICGMGEDAGVAESYLHETISNGSSGYSEPHVSPPPPPPPPSSLLGHQEPQPFGNNSTMTTSAATTNVLEETSRMLGIDHVAHVKRVQYTTGASSSSVNQQRQQQQHQNQQQPHVIPPDQNNLPTTTLSLSSIQATCLWCSASWTPIPARSLGFAIGPFKVLEDPEYFGPTGPAAAAIAAVQADDDGDDDDDDVESGMERRLLAFCQAARQNGEGIRQVYFAPLMERKYLHTGTSANRRLLPNTRILLQPLSMHQRKTIHDLNQTVTFATVGVAHRALSLMRDVLALPTYRTVAYTQVWIPHAVDGGTTSGALRSCPECLVNPFLGGAILDARLLPPINSKLPYYQGGRVLQFLQARNAIRGWILAALPLGGNDDVGNGYIHTLVESFIMSLYERGHGSWGEGGARGGVFFSRRYSRMNGLNSSNLDFLPVRNIEEMSSVAGGLAAVPVGTLLGE
jgi:hypothetical protein